MEKYTLSHQMTFYMLYLKLRNDIPHIYRFIWYSSYNKHSHRFIWYSSYNKHSHRFIWYSSYILYKNNPHPLSSDDDWILQIYIYSMTLAKKEIQKQQTWMNIWHQNCEIVIIQLFTLNLHFCFIYSLSNPEIFYVLSSQDLKYIRTYAAVMNTTAF